MKFSGTAVLSGLIIILSAPGEMHAAESPYLYGIHDHSPDPSEYLAHITNATGAGGWITATVAVGANTNDQSGTDFTALANAGHSVICRINYGYFPDGTIPVAAKYDDFAIRCKTFVAHSPGCNIWLIGNELNLAAEWPFDGARFNYISPQQYATLYRKVYDAIRSVRPTDKILPQACAPWGGPYGAGTQNVNGTNYPADGMPLTWVQYENQMLSAITNTGPVDGVALHIGSRGYHYADIHSTNKFGGLNLYSSFYVYKDWIDYGIPSALYNLPLYVTECNGLYYWKGGGPPGEDPAQHYEPGWMQEIYAEIARHNQSAATNGKPIFRCLNMYRWCGFCDGWNLDGASDIFKAQILNDLDAAAAQRYAWPTNLINTNPPPAPTGLTASVGNGNIALTWNSAPFATSYNVKRATISGGPYSTIASNVTGSAYLNTSYAQGTTYYFVLTAVNSYGQSTNSSQVSATPTNALPDVIVTSVDWNIAGLVYAPTNVVFRANVRNQGSAATPGGVTLGVGFLVDGSQVSWSGGFSSPVNPGGSVILSADGGPVGVNYWAATPGLHVITANVDDIDRFAEGNEANNALDRALTVYARGYSINSGGSAVGTYAADAYWTGSANTFSVTNTIDTSALTNPAPQSVYQTERWGASTYTFPNLVPGTNYTVRLHLAEISPSVAGPGDRRFNIVMNGKPVLTNFDVFAATGAKFRAIARQFYVLPDAEGRITLQLTQGASNEPKVSGIEIKPASALSRPLITSTRQGPDAVVLSWPAYPGKTYQLQFKDSLGDPQWTNLGADILAGTDTLSATNSTTISQQRFFRVLRLD